MYTSFCIYIKKGDSIYTHIHTHYFYRQHKQHNIWKSSSEPNDLATSLNTPEHTKITYNKYQRQTQCIL